MRNSAEKLNLTTLPYRDALDEREIHINELGSMEEKRTPKLAWRRAGLDCTSRPEQVRWQHGDRGERISRLIHTYLTLQLRWSDSVQRNSRVVFVGNVIENTRRSSVGVGWIGAIKIIVRVYATRQFEVAPRLC